MPGKIQVWNPNPWTLINRRSPTRSILTCIFAVYFIIHLILSALTDLNIRVQSLVKPSSSPRRSVCWSLEAIHQASHPLGNRTIKRNPKKVHPYSDQCRAGENRNQWSIGSNFILIPPAAFGLTTIIFGQPGGGASWNPTPLSVSIFTSRGAGASSTTKTVSDQDYIRKKLNQKFRQCKIKTTKT